MEPDTSFLRSEIVVLGTFAVCVFLFLSNFHICGMVGDFLSSVMLGVFGTIGYLAPVLLFAGVIFYASNKGNIRAVYKMLAVEILLLVLCGLAQMTLGGGYKEGQTLMDIYEAAGESGMGGGLIGGAIVYVLHTALGTIGSYLVLFLFFIISLVAITEKSFVSAVKSGSDKVYHQAKEDYDRHKEIREIKREEKRLLREEQKVQGVDLESTDLSKDGVLAKLAAAEEEMEEVEVNAAYRAAYEAEEKALQNAVHKKGKKKGTSVSDDNPIHPADVFKGKITKAGEEEEDVVPFDEDVKPASYKKDEDIFVSRDSKTFREMGLFPEDESGRKIMENLEQKKSSGSVFDMELDTEPYVETSDYWEPVHAFSPDEVNVQAEKEAVAASIPTVEYVEEYPFEADPMPMEAPVNKRESVVFHSPEERKQVVTATGKVIDTDTEEILKKKAEKRKLDAAEKEEADKAVLQEIKKTEEKPKKPYVFPPLDLLARSKGPAGGQSDKEFRETAIKLQQTLRNFGVGVTVTNISCGPTVTRYELQPEQGVKVSKIQSLADDIKLNLAATDIRIEAPIPGKAAVGIEVPNKVNSMVYLRELLESNEVKKHPSRLAFAVGKDIGGQVIVADLAKMPHLLIAGQTGSGKSVGINTMIMSLIYRSSPDDVKLIMIDPKVVELSVYNGIPHLLIPVVTDPKKAAGALNWAVAEMMERYNKFAKSNVRDIKGYNARVQSLIDAGDVPNEEIPTKLPQLVIIIDELADLMMVASNEVEDAICRLAQLARAAGIHLVIATQRPSVNVITGVIKANVPSRIAFSVASGVDSRTILDMVGAEKLLGNGDMLFYPSGYPKPLRVQGAFVSDSEVTKVTDFLKEQNEDSGGYNKEIEMKMSQPTLGGTSNGGGNDRDSLFVDAGKFIIEKDKASIGMLQRVFKIGFNRAARIMDQLAEAGVVGEEEGTKPRKVLMSMEEFEEFLEAGY
ncbi:MAG: DNA translocase FtsK 4TM domain-containing protein [Lachnospiraceae bacterium]|nr:DNA translocase FtsK 4TM domain-containing protein [Lachnospiraceae bacterium]